MTMTLTILGCGSSGGVPRIGPNWGVCDPANPKNRRRRASILIQRQGDGEGEGETRERGKTNVLIDTSPDIREQLISARIGLLDAVVFTHDHADHTHGIDDLRMAAFNAKRRVHVYFDGPTRASLTSRFSYCFKSAPGSDYPPILEARDLCVGQPIRVSGRGGDVEVLPLDQEHGNIRSLGVRIGNVAYCSDVSSFPPQTLHQLQGLDTLIIGALRYIPHPAHFTVRQALTWIDRIRPKRAILTHLHIDLDYAALKKELPENVEPAFDGMTVDIAPPSE
jgi:phosphoribosyl 1,2-cyclic phosphate phosphodiesterase